jgi:cytochrome c oxidase subunit 3
MLESPVTGSALTPAQAAHRTGTPQLTVLIVVGMETVFFATLLASYLYLHSNPAGPLFFRTGLAGALLPAANTLLLLLSAGLAGGSLRAIRRGSQGGLQFGLNVTLGAGILFILAQAVEFSRLGLRPADSILGATYMALVGFHALHVLAGVVFLALNSLRARLGDFTARRYDAIQAGTWFWYYVTAVWLVLFAVLYFF